MLVVLVGAAGMLVSVRMAVGLRGDGRGQAGDEEAGGGLHVCSKRKVGWATDTGADAGRSMYIWSLMRLGTRGMPWWSIKPCRGIQLGIRRYNFVQVGAKRRKKDCAGLGGSLCNEGERCSQACLKE